MKSVTVSKNFLINKIEENLASRQKDYLEAIEELSKKVNEGSLDDLSIFDFPPENRIKDYERSLAMVKASVDINITLTSQEFDQLVLDRWNCKY